MELKSDGETEDDRSEPDDSKTQSSEEPEVDHDTNTESDKHIDLKA